MRPIVKTTLCVAVAVAAPALAASSNYYLKLGDVSTASAAKASGGKQLEIESWSWGATMAGKFGAVSGAHRDDSVAAPGAAEKPVLSKVEACPEHCRRGRQHGWVTVAKPLDRGAVRVKVKFPWLDCRVGAAFPDAVLQNDAGRYEFQDAIITGCAPDSVTLNYAKVKVRGWDPAKKEE